MEWRSQKSINHMGKNSKKNYFNVFCFLPNTSNEKAEIIIEGNNFIIIERVSIEDGKCQW